VTLVDTGQLINSISYQVVGVGAPEESSTTVEVLGGDE
jgi:hypothetical protein